MSDGAFIRRPWRTGRKVSRTIHVVIGDQPDTYDPLIGLMDTVELAREAVESHNAALILAAGTRSRNA